MLTSTMHAQMPDQYNRSKVVELNGSKQDLFDKANYVIANMYTSSNNVMQLSEIKTGIVLKASTKIEHLQFDYTLNLKFKDDRYLIEISHLTSGKTANGSIMQVTNEHGKTGWGKKRHKRVMDSLILEIDNIVSRMIESMEQTQLTASEDW